MATYTRKPYQYATPGSYDIAMQWYFDALRNKDLRDASRLADLVKQNPWSTRSVQGTSTYIAPAPAPAPAPAAPASTPVEEVVEEPLYEANFEGDVPTSYNEDLVRQSIAQRVAKFIQPLLERNIGQTQQRFAGRGLFRSGMRGKAERDVADYYAGEQQEREETLFKTNDDEYRQLRDAERDAYNKFISGKTVSQVKENPYKPSSEFSGYEVDYGTYDPVKAPEFAKVTGMYDAPMQKDRYGGLGVTESAERGYRFAPSFRQYVENKYPSLFLNLKRV